MSKFTHLLFVVAAMNLAALRPAANDQTTKSPTEHREALRQYALSHKGQAKSGRIVASKLDCASCHDLKGAEQGVGPALSDVGGRLSRVEVVEQILDPSRKSKLIQVAFEDGSSKEVVLLKEDRETLKVCDQQTKEVQTLVNAQLDGFKPMPSEMPEGQADALTPEDFTDLIEFLLAQKKP